MAKRYLTILVVPDRDSRTRHYRVPIHWLVRSGVALGIGLAALAGLGYHYSLLLERAAEARLLEDENEQLRGRLQLVQEKIAHIDETLDRVEKVDEKLRAVTTLGGGEKSEPSEAGEAPEEGHDGTDAHLIEVGGIGGPAPHEELDAELDGLVDEALRNERSLVELTRYFEGQQSLLASTPAIWPARGWVTSDFGTRLDPYTASRAMHRGVDIANRAGTPIVSPADGVVVYAGYEGGYGKVIVVDHGFGVRTRYAHLAEIDAQLGERVKKGQQIGAIGNTGRSTGPHLHYEVRVNGVPENPRKFVLE